MISSVASINIVEALTLFVSLMFLFRQDGELRLFEVVFDVCEDIRAAHVILWGRRGRLWKVHVCPSLEPDARFLVCTKRERRCDNSGGFYSDGLKEDQDVIAIDCKGG